jgi:hypothetical protein
MDSIMDRNTLTKFDRREQPVTRGAWWPHPSLKDTSYEPAGYTASSSANAITLNLADRRGTAEGRARAQSEASRPASRTGPTQAGILLLALLAGGDSLAACYPLALRLGQVHGVLLREQAA